MVGNGWAIIKHMFFVIAFHISKNKVNNRGMPYSYVDIVHLPSLTKLLYGVPSSFTPELLGMSATERITVNGVYTHSACAHMLHVLHLHLPGS